jgi:hypothetical protein
MTRDTATDIGAGPLGGALVLVFSATLLVACSGAPEPRNGPPDQQGATLPAAIPGTSLGTPQSAPDGEPATTTEADSEASRGDTLPAPRRSGSAEATRDGTGKASESLASRAEKDDTLILIDQREAPPTTTLAEAARKAREERDKAPRPKIVITDDNLAEYATGELTVAAPEKPASAGDDSAAEGAAPDLGRDEEHWRQGARELRLKLRRAWDEAQTLQEQVAGLRVRFYAEDDPHVRDSEIKPAWDRALERQRQVEEEVRAYRRQLDQFLEEGRRAGALPGWLREGIEYEPERKDETADENEEAREGFGHLEPVEPERMENPSRPPE